MSLSCTETVEAVDFWEKVCQGKLFQIRLECRLFECPNCGSVHYRWEEAGKKQRSATPRAPVSAGEPIQDV